MKAERWASAGVGAALAAFAGYKAYDDFQKGQEARASANAMRAQRDATTEPTAKNLLNSAAQSYDQALASYTNGALALAGVATLGLGLTVYSLWKR